MFRKLQNNPIIDEISSGPYADLKIDENKRKCCENVFGENIPDESIIVYSPNKKTQLITVLGCYVLNRQSMTTSVLYPALRENTKYLNKIDLHSSILNSNCIKIQEWIFDVSLKNRKKLFRIFSNMIGYIHLEHDRLTFLWCDKGFNELIFYPINNNSECIYSFAEFYFSTVFECCP